ncbi:uncharacterized protein LOC110847464 isoform X2 [Folsomia candida]|nr:uncharacterized protein LOC110847464 isoform X2 [Folsomia candida]
MKNASDALRRAENTPRTTVVLSDSDDDDDDKSSDDSESSEDSDSDDQEQESKPAESQVSTEESYLKLKTRLMKRMMRRETRSKLRIEKLLAKLGKNQTKYTQCNICWIEQLETDKHEPLRVEHKRQHTDGEFKLCQFCGMSFLYEYYLEKHLEDLSVPTVPSTMSPLEAEDLLHETHSCPDSGCGEIFANRKCLLFHRTNTHDHYHRCPTCEKVYILYSDMRKHIQRVHNYENRLLPCPVPQCDKSFRNRRGISSHMTHAHTVEEKEKYFTSTIGQPNNKIDKTESDKNANNDEEDDDKSNVVATSLPPEISVRHNLPQPFWSRRNAKLVKIRDLIRKNRLHGPRRKFKSISARPSLAPLPSQKQRSLNTSNNFLTNKPFLLPVRQTPISVNQQPSVKCKPKTKSANIITKLGGFDLRYKGAKYRKSLLSVPPKQNVNFNDKRRSIPSHRTFSMLCSLCTRGFRTRTDRDAHMGSTHHLDFTQEKPYICPITDCDKRNYVNGPTLLRHIRSCHPPSVDEELFRHSIEEDKLAEAANPSSTLKCSDLAANECQTNNMMGRKGKIAAKMKLEKDFCDQQEKEKKVRKRQKQISPGHLGPTNRNLTHSSGPTPARRRQFPRRVLGRSSEKHGPEAITIREVLAKFKLKTGYYCPECPVPKGKSFASTWNVHRHLEVLHPTSTFLLCPGSIKDKNIGGDGIFSTKIIEEEDEESEEEVAGPSRPVEEDEEIEDAANIKMSNVKPKPQPRRTPSSTSTGNPLLPFKLPNGKYYCPECNSDPSSQPKYSRPFELLRHVSDCHPGSSLLTPKKSSREIKPVIKRTSIKKTKLTEIKNNKKQESGVIKTFDCPSSSPVAGQNSSLTLSNHMEEPTTTTFPCPLCFKIFKACMSRRAHMRWCKLRKQKLLPQVGKLFSKYTKSTNTKTFCALCSKKFMSSRALAAHKGWKHSSAKSLSNTDCSEFGREIDPAICNMPKAKSGPSSSSSTATKPPLIKLNITNSDSQGANIDPSIILHDSNATPQTCSERIASIGTGNHTTRVKTRPKRKCVKY